MEQHRKMPTGFAWAALFLTFCAPITARVANSANPYYGITVRNLFHLRPPTPSREDQEPEKPQPPKITLTGITTILLKKVVLMNFMLPAKPGEQPKLKSLILSLGQREEEIEVLEIDEWSAGGTVKLVNHGVTQVLNMERDGARLSASVTTALPAVPGVAQIPALLIEATEIRSDQLHTRAPHPDEQAIRMLVQQVEHSDQGIRMPPLPPPLEEILENPKP